MTPGKDMRNSDQKFPEVLDEEGEPGLVNGGKHYPHKYYEFSGRTVSPEDCAKAVLGTKIYRSDPVQKSEHDNAVKAAYENCLGKMQAKLDPIGFKQVMKVTARSGKAVAECIKKYVAEGKDEAERKARKETQGIFKEQAWTRLSRRPKKESEAELFKVQPARDYAVCSACCKMSSLNPEKFSCCKVLEFDVVVVEDDTTTEVCMRPTRLFPHPRNCNRGVGPTLEKDEYDLPRGSGWMVVKFPYDDIVGTALDGFAERYGSWTPDCPLPPGRRIEFRTQAEKTHAEYTKEDRKYVGIPTTDSWHADCMRSVSELWDAFVRVYMHNMMKQNNVHEFTVDAAKATLPHPDRPGLELDEIDKTMVALALIVGGFPCVPKGKTYQDVIDGRVSTKGFTASQPPHTDMTSDEQGGELYDASENPKLKGMTKPQSFVIPGQDYRDIMLHDRNGKWTRVRVEKGQILFFDADVIHAGANYEADDMKTLHWAIHGYVESFKHPWKSDDPNLGEEVYSTEAGVDHVDRLSMEAQGIVFETLKDRLLRYCEGLEESNKSLPVLKQRMESLGKELLDRAASIPGKKVAKKSLKRRREEDEATEEEEEAVAVEGAEGNENEKRAARAERRSCKKVSDSEGK